MFEIKLSYNLIRIWTDNLVREKSIFLKQYCLLNNMVTLVNNNDDDNNNVLWIYLKFAKKVDV